MVLQVLPKPLYKPLPNLPRTRKEPYRPESFKNFLQEAVQCIVTRKKLETGLRPTSAGNSCTH